MQRKLQSRRHLWMYTIWMDDGNPLQIERENNSISNKFTLKVLNKDLDRRNFQFVFRLNAGPCAASMQVHLVWHEEFDFDECIGYYTTMNSQVTKAIYSKTGAHIVPSHPNR